MTTPAILPEGRQRYFNNDGTPAAGAKLYTYLAGTTTPKVAYQDAAGTVPHMNPITLDAKGEAVIFWDGAYKVDVKQADGAQITGYPVDGLKSDPHGVAGIVAALASVNGAAQIGFHGSPGRTVEQQLDMLYYGIAIPTDPKFAGGAKDDGTDATVAIQAAIDQLPAGGVLHGQGRTFTVTSLLLKSNMGLENIKLVTKAGSADMASPVTIDGRATPKSNIRIFDVEVDGNRINQTNIGASEDGGRHGFRLVGKCSNILIQRCKATYCASDGIELFSSSSIGASDTAYVFQNIVVRDCVFQWNRRHGWSADAAFGILLDNVEFTYNGLDLNTVDPVTSGGRGARVGANLYGNGMDWEGYGLGSGLNNIRLRNVRALYNARGGCLFYDALDTRPAGFAARSKIWITDCYFDEGQDASRSGEALTFTSTISSKALAPLYDSVYISNTRLDGFFLVRGSSNIQFDGEIRATSTAERPITSYALLDYATDIVLDVVPAGNVKKIYADTSTYSLGNEAVPTPANPTLSFVTGATGALSNVVCTLLENVRDRTCRFLITAKWTGTVAGTPVFSIAPAAGGVLAAPPRVDVIRTDTAKVIPAAYDVSIGSVRFDDPATAALNLQFIVDVKV